MLDQNTKVIQGISTEDGKKTYINAKYWNNYEVKDIKTIGGYSIFKESENDDNNIVIHSDSIIEIAYSDLKKLRDNSELMHGIKYKITDYVTTTSQENTQSAGHRFDIIVIADSNNTLNENARVCLNKNDDYFENSNLNAWEIKYSLDNDVDRFSWADEMNGKGVIYYMKDEFDNELFYDFKNIKYNITSYQTRPTGYEYAYTFTDSLTGNDISLTKNVRNNTVNKLTNINGIQLLNSTIFLCTTNDVHNNILEENSSNNLIWVSSFYYNNIGRAFQNNIISATYDGSRTSVNNNVIGSLFKNNKINSIFDRNTIDNSVSYCNFYQSFSFNRIDSNCHNIDFNYPVNYCEFGSNIQYCVFNNNSSYPSLVNEMKWCVFEGGLYGGQYIPCCQRVTFQKALHTEQSNFELQNIKLIDGRIMSDVLTRKHNEHLYVYRVGDKFGIYKNSEERIKTLTPLFSNPNLDFESTKNNADCYGYVGNLSDLNVFGDNILIDSIGVYVREGESSQNLNVPVWCRLLKFVNGAWEIISQSENSKSIGEIYPENLFTFKMVNKSINPILKNSDKIAIVYVENEDSDVLSGVFLGFKVIDKPGCLSSVISNNNNVLDFAPAFVFGYTSMGSETSDINLGNFSIIDDVYSKAAEIDICSNQNITRMTFKIDKDNDGRYSNGFIEQFISGEVDGTELYYIVQTLYFDGSTSSRQIVYKFINGVKTIHEVGNWYKIIGNDNHNIDAPVLYSRNSEVVNIGGEQTITGNKQFDGDINLSGKTIIKNGDINPGELKVFNSNDDSLGFIIRTNEKFDNNIPILEILSMNNNDGYRYQFPKLTSTNVSEKIVVESIFNNLSEKVQENEEVTSFALNELNEKIDDINYNIIRKFIYDVTYKELVNLRDNFELVPGMQYRITDYVTTTIQENTKSAGHQFDIIVTADSDNSLNEIARVCLNKNDDYFNDSNLNAWQIWYCLDNDGSRFAWADKKNGKGVIYRMIDEFGNDCPYDFKNIKFKRIIDENNITKYLYTFSYKDSDETISDLSIVGNNGKLGITNAVYDNVICKYINNVDDNDLHNLQRLSNNVFLIEDNNDNNIVVGVKSNTLLDGCYSNTFNDGCVNCNLGIGCYENKFGFECKGITLGRSCNNNDFGIRCYYNIFGDFCRRNKFGDYCGNNNIGPDCYNINLGSYSSYNKFGLSCSSIKIGNNCNMNSFGGYCTNIIFQLPNNTETLLNYVANINCMNSVVNLNLTYDDENIDESGYNLSNINVLTGDYIGLVIKSKSNKIVSKYGIGGIKIFSFEDLIRLIN